MNLPPTTHVPTSPQPPPPRSSSSVTMDEPATSELTVHVKRSASSDIEAPAPKRGHPRRASAKDQFTAALKKAVDVYREQDEAERAVLEGRIAELEVEVGGLEDDKKKDGGEKNKLKARIAELEDLVLSLYDESDNAKKNLNKRTTELQRKLALSIAAKQDQIDKLEADLNRQNILITKLEKDGTEQRRATRTYIDLEKVYNAEKDMMKAEITELQDMLQCARIHQKEARAKIKAAEEETKNLRKIVNNYNTVKESNEKMHRDKRSVELNLDGMYRHYRDVQGKNAVLVDKLEAIENTMSFSGKAKDTAWEGFRSRPLEELQEYKF
ncbi:uncharacterized protein BDR25DRAFT_311350 [Lindgomyces ingoldianus]|uniref:Uncharacterized protein n=1 Tax=Lindgomyces ingoldianus TaxID=673940 RepID=A0ACB6R9F9_9PLEO|nr:uncharacterized protein BDR25DRAFT_311350 [Lindgomyces ingoldianus]KAF2474965.1 hypothetical protein BDR25DRAFT_311350 [Lindgomyces ingoldianus]